MQGLLENYLQLAVWLQSAIALVGLALAALAVNWLLKKVLLRAAAPFLDRRSDTADKAAARAATAAPLLVVSQGILLVPHLVPSIATVIHNVAEALIVLSVAMAASGVLDYAMRRGLPWHSYMRCCLTSAMPVGSGCAHRGQPA